MASLAHHTRNLFLKTKSSLSSAQSYRNGSSFVKFCKKKEYNDADRLKDGSSVQAILTAMASRGFCRPKKPYNPPEDFEQRLMQIFQKHLPEENLSDLSKVKLSHPTKFLILKSCVGEFGHDVPNYELANLSTLEQVVSFFSQRVDGLNPYDRLVAHKDNLPENLHVIAKGVRFHPDRDTLFKGVTAYPGSGTTVKGLRSKKLYESFEMDREWPYATRT